MKKLLLALLFCLITMSSWALTGTFQDGVSPTAGYTGTTDTKLRENNAASNYGTDELFQIVVGATPDRYNFLIRFDLSSITGTVTVTSATLSFRLEDASTTDTIICKRLLRNWSETQATWNIYSTGNSWTAAGGAYNAADCNATTSASAVVDANNGFKDWTSAQLAADVQDMINNPSTNYGWVFLGDGTGANNVHTFRAREGTDASKHPILTFTYTVNAPATPASCHNCIIINQGQ